MWTEEAVVVLHRLWNEGKSAGFIAHEMNRTRNSIIGKLDRHGWLRTRGPSSTQVVRVQKVKPGPKPKPKPVVRYLPALRKYPPVPAIALPPLNIPFLDRVMFQQCAFICEGEGLEALACGHPTVAEGNYCAGHKALCTERARRR